MTAINMTVVGNLARDPELKYAPSGAASASFTVASTERTHKDGRWEDGTTTWVRCVAWRDLAEHIAETFHQGDRVIATGTIRQRDWTAKTGENRSEWELTASDCGPSLQFATARVTKAAAKTVREPDPAF